MKVCDSQFLKNGSENTYFFEVRIVIYDKKNTSRMSFSRFGTDMCRDVYTPHAHVPCFLPLSRAAGRDGATLRHHPSQGHGSSPAALHQKPRCIADSRDSIVPVQFSSLPDVDAEPPAVPAPQRVMLHPHQLHISTSRELLAYPWWPCVSAKTGRPHDISQKPHDSS